MVESNTVKKFLDTLFIKGEFEYTLKVYTNLNMLEYDYELKILIDTERMLKDQEYQEYTKKFSELNVLLSRYLSINLYQIDIEYVYKDVGEYVRIAQEIGSIVVNRILQENEHITKYTKVETEDDFYESYDFGVYFNAEPLDPEVFFEVNSNGSMCDAFNSKYVYDITLEEFKKININSVLDTLCEFDG